MESIASNYYFYLNDRARFVGLENVIKLSEGIQRRTVAREEENVYVVSCFIVRRVRAKMKTI